MVKAHRAANKDAPIYIAHRGSTKPPTQTAARDSVITELTIYVFKITKGAQPISRDNKLDTTRCPAEITAELVCYCKTLH